MEPEGLPTTPPSTPWHLWVVGVLGLLWNSVGVFDFVMTQLEVASYMEQFSAEQVAALQRLPLWLRAFWGVAVCGGLAGCLLLLFRNRTCASVLLVSLLSMMVTAAHNAVAPEGMYSIGGTSPGFVGLIFLVALGLWFYAKARSFS